MSKYFDKRHRKMPCGAAGCPQVGTRLAMRGGTIAWVCEDCFDAVKVVK